MEGEKKISEILKLQGFVDRKEAAAILGMVDGGNFPRLMEKHSVRSVSLGKRLMYLESDVLRIKPLFDEVQPVGGETNGGKLMRDIKQLRERVEVIEKWKQEYDN